MSNHVAVGCWPDEVKSGRVERNRASNGRRAPRALFVLLALASLMFAGAPWAAAQTIIAQAYATTRQLEQPGGCNYHLVVASASAELEDTAKDHAQAFSLILVPLRSVPGQKNYVFSIYRFGNERFRDDDRGTYSLIQAGVNADNLLSFFKAAGCQLASTEAAEMAGFIGGEDFPTVNAFAGAVSLAADGTTAPPRPIASAVSPPNLKVDSRDKFGVFVNDFSHKVTWAPPGSVLPPLTPRDEDRDLERLVSYWQAQSAYWRGQADARGGDLRWWIPAGVAVLAALAVLLALAYLGRRLFRRRSPSRSEPEPTPTLSPYAARELHGILDNFHPNNIRKRSLPTVMVEELCLKLQSKIVEFSKQHRPVGLKELKSILKSFDRGYKQAKKQPEHLVRLYERLWGDLEEYLINYKPSPSDTGDRAAGADVLKGAQEDCPSVHAQVERLAVQGEEQRGSASTIHPPLTAQELKAHLPVLAVMVAELMSGYREQIRELSQLWSDADVSVPEGALDEIVEKSKAAVSMVELLRGRFQEQGLSVEASKIKVENLLNKLDQLGKNYLTGSEAGKTTPDKILEGLAGRLESSNAHESMLKIYRQEETEAAEKLGILLGPNESVFYAAQRMAEDLKKALQLLDDYRTPNNVSVAVPVQRIKEKLGALQRGIDHIEKTIKQAAPATQGTPQELVQYLVGELDAAKAKAAQKEADARREAERADGLDAERLSLLEKLNSTQPEISQSVELVGEVLRRLNYNADKPVYSVEPVATLLHHLRDEAPSSWRLRQSLSAARAALVEAIDDGMRPDVAEVLKLAGITQGLERLLELMEDFTGEDIWKKGIDSGFSTNWMHDLLRANHLLQAYFPDGELYRMRGAVTQACAALDVIMRDHGARVAPVNIFGQPCDGMEKVNPDAALLAMPEVKARVKAEYYAKNRSDGFVVDVKLSRVLVGDEVRERGRAAVMIRSDWGV